jgi:predicted Zn finger-like uncharacterized protein
MRFVCDSCRAQYMISDDKVGAKGVKVRCKKCGYVILVRRAETTQVASMPLGGPEGMAAGAEPGEEQPTRPHAALTDPAAPPPASPSVADGAVAAATAANGSSITTFGGNGAAGPVLGGVEDDEIGAVFDQVLKSGSPKIDGKKPEVEPSHEVALGGDDDEQVSTRVVDANSLRRIAAEAEALALGRATRGEEPGSSEAQDPPGDRKEPEEKETEEVPENDWFVAVDDQQVGPISLEKLKDMWERGEVGPDSLCWRAGFSDWTALSGVAALASVLAPKPPKPVIAASAPVVGPASGAVVTVPVESTFSSGGMSQSIRAEVPVMAAASAASTGDTGSWQPSAASALASLVKEEMSVLQKPASTRSSLLDTGPNDRPSGPRGRNGTGGGLLDLPPAPHDGPGANGRPAAGLLGIPSAGPGTPIHPSPAAASQPEVAPAQAFNASSYPAYMPPPQPHASPGVSRSLVIALSVAGVLLIGLLGVVLFLLLRPPAPAPATEVASRGTDLPMPPPPRTEPAAAPAPPPPAAPPAAPAAAPPPAAAAPPAAPAAEAAPEPAPAAPAAPASPPLASANPLPRPAKPRTRTTSGGGSEEGDEITPRSTRPPPSPAVSSGGDTDDDFDREFGGGSSSSGDRKKTETGEKKKTVYVPEEPGRGAQKESLEKSDIMAVVLENKSKIADCVNQQKAKQPGLTGQLVMRWTILPSGRTSGVSVQSDEFKATYMATCISGLVKSMQFPRHKVQGEPIVFPFRF